MPAKRMILEGPEDCVQKGAQREQQPEVTVQAWSCTRTRRHGTKVRGCGSRQDTWGFTSLGVQKV